MTPAASLKVLAAILLFFAIGHTLGTASPRAERGPQESAVFATMQNFRFPIMGFTRSHWDFYRGFALTISVLQFMIAAVSWQLAAIARRNPGDALPMAITLQLACAAQLILAWMFFFGAPIVTSLIAVVWSTVVVILLAKRRTREVP